MTTIDSVTQTTRDSNLPSRYTFTLDYHRIAKGRRQKAETDVTERDVEPIKVASIRVHSPLLYVVTWKTRQRCTLTER